MVRDWGGARSLVSVEGGGVARSTAHSHDAREKKSRVAVEGSDATGDYVSHELYREKCVAEWHSESLYGNASACLSL